MRKQILGSALAGAMIVTTGLSVSAQRAEPRERPQRAQPTTPTQQRVDPAQQARNQVCPADIENLQVQAEELQNGGAMVFTTDQQNVETLRQRLTQFVQIHDQQLQQMAGQREGATTQREGAMPQREGATARREGAMPQREGATARREGTPPRSPRAGAAGGAQGQRFADAQALLHRGNVQMIEIPNGALLIFEVADRALVSSLRTEIMEGVQAVQQGRCPLAFQLETA